MTAVRFSPEAMTEFERILAKYPVRRSALIPTLRLAQQEFGYLSPSAIQYVAELMCLSPMDVLSVTSFYEMLHTKPVGKRHIWVCRNLSCVLRGAERLVRHIESRLGIRVGQTTRDGRFSLAVAECLGACDKAPMFWCNDAYYEDLTPEKADALIAQWEKELQEAGEGGPSAAAAADPEAGAPRENSSAGSGEGGEGT